MPRSLGAGLQPVFTGAYGGGLECESVWVDLDPGSTGANEAPGATGVGPASGLVEAYLVL